jgi:sugar lactone lactonase YvrE
MAGTAARPFLDGLTFGEGPRWRDGRLWFSDFFTTSVRSVAPADASGDGAAPPAPRHRSGPDAALPLAGLRRHEMTVAGRPSGIGWLPDGRLLAVSMTTRALVRREPDGTSARHADLAPFAPHSANDLLVHPDGYAYVGHFGFDLEAFFEGRARPEPASLLRVALDGSVAVAADDLWFPNGMALIGSTLVVAETFGGRLSAFEVGTEGRLSHRRVWANLDGRHPDGLCADAEGAVWVADAGGPECLRVGEGGRILGRVTTSQPCYACALGGAERTVLFCLTAPTSRAGARAAARDGRIEVARVPVPGETPVGPA